MSKKKRQVLTDEMEYEFKETGEPHTDEIPDEEFGAEALESKPKLGFLQHRLVKRVGIILILVIAVAIVYKFITPSNVQPETKQQTVTTKTETVAPAITAAQANVQREVDLLSQESVALEDQLKQLQTDVQNLNVRMDQLATGLNDVNTKVQTYIDKLQTMQQEPAKEVKKTSVSHKKVVKKVSAPQPVYELKAVVPGRAWVQTKAGHLTTVKVGDRLAGYGTVRSIDIDTGVVGTSSGRAIKYGPNDS